MCRIEPDSYVDGYTGEIAMPQEWEDCANVLADTVDTEIEVLKAKIAELETFVNRIVLDYEDGRYSTGRELYDNGVALVGRQLSEQEQKGNDQ